MTIECELAEIRKKRKLEWDATKHHLRLARSMVSLGEEEGLKMVDNESLSHKTQENQTNHIVINI